MRILLAIAMLASCGPSPRPAAPTISEADLKALELKRLAALGVGDAATLETIFADSFVVTLDGATRTKAQVLERQRAAAAEGVKRQETAEDLTVHPIADGVVVVRGTAVATEANGEVRRVRFTNVWRHGGAGWQIAVGHVGGTPK